MLQYITFFLIVLIISIIIVWAYRSVFSRLGFKHNVMGKSVTAIRPKIKAQRGYISRSRESAKHKKLPSPKGGYKAPWGW